VISEATVYRWRSGYGGLKMDRARRLPDLERGNARLKRAVAELQLDEQILKEARLENVSTLSAASGQGMGRLSSASIKPAAGPLHRL
jgi:hypothetical protein